MDLDTFVQARSPTMLIVAKQWVMTNRNEDQSSVLPERFPVKPAQWQKDQSNSGETLMQGKATM